MCGPPYRRWTGCAAKDERSWILFGNDVALFKITLQLAVRLRACACLVLVGGPGREHHVSTFPLSRIIHCSLLLDVGGVKLKRKVATTTELHHTLKTNLSSFYFTAQNCMCVCVFLRCDQPRNKSPWTA